MSQELNPLMNWLNNCRERTIRIEKRESNDLDVVELQMNDVSYTEHTKGHLNDDYIAPKEIVLYGEGKIRNSEEQPPIPNHCYEIPLVGQWNFTAEEQGLRIKTERASYELTIV